MPTVFIYHEVKDKDHWLASPRREEFLGPLGVTNIRLFVDPENPTRVGGLMDIPDRARDARDPRRSLTDAPPFFCGADWFGFWIHF